MTFSKLLRPIIIVLLSISAISIIAKIIYRKYYEKSDQNIQENFAQNVPSAAPTVAQVVVSATAPAVESSGSYSASSGPYIQNTNPSDNKFPTLNPEQQKCIGKFTADCLKTLSANQGELYNSLVTAPSQAASSMTVQIAYNTAVVSPQ